MELVKMQRHREDRGFHAIKRDPENNGKPICKQDFDPAEPVELDEIFYCSRQEANELIKKRFAVEVRD